MAKHLVNVMALLAMFGGTHLWGEEPQEKPAPARDKPGAVLGVFTDDLSPEVKARFRVTSDAGQVIVVVEPNSPAAKAGLRPGDVIIKADAKDVASNNDLRDAINKVGAGKEITLKVVRGKETKEIKAQLAEAPEGRRGPPSFPPEPRGRAQQLEQRIEQLEKRVQELEKLLKQQNPPPK